MIRSPRAPFRGSRTWHGCHRWSCDRHPWGSPPLQSLAVPARDLVGFRLSAPSLAPLDAGSRRFRRVRDCRLATTAWTSLLRLAASSVTRVQASSALGKWNRRKTIPTGAPLVGFAPLRRMRSGESTSHRLATADYGAAHAVLHDFSGLLLTRPPDCSGNALGVSGAFKGFPSHGSSAVAGFRPS